MRIPTLSQVATQLHRRTVLGSLALVLAAGLTACDSAGPTGPDLGPSVDPAPVPLRQVLGKLLSAADLSIQPVAKTVVRRPSGIGQTAGAPRAY